MNRKRARLTLIFAVFGALAFAQTNSLTDAAIVQEPKQPPKSEAKPGNASLTGCIDEQDGLYVLIDDRSLTTLANLEADGFPTEGFAKYLGHKVTVRGIANSGTARPIFKVRSVESISDSCAPKQP